MANYNSPYQLYTPANPGDTFLKGFGTGLNVKRNIEETAKLVRDREQQEQAQKVMMDVSKELEAAEADYITKDAKAKEMVGQGGDGHPVAEADLLTSIRHTAESRIKQIHTADQVALRLMQEGLRTGNTILLENGRKMQDHAMQQATQADALQANLLQSRDRRYGVDTAADTAEMEAKTRAEIAAEDRASREQQTNTEQAGASQRAALQSRTQLAEANIQESGANFRSTTQVNAQTQIEKDKLAEDTRQFDVLRKEANNPAATMERTLKIAEGVTVLSGAGWSDEQINHAFKGQINVAEFRDKLAGLEDDMKVQVTDQTKYLKELEQRRDGGDPNVGDKITKTKARLKRLYEKNDQLKDARYEREDLAADPGMAASVGRGFITVLGFGADVLMSPERALEGAAQGALHKIDEATGAEPRGDFKPTWGDVSKLLGLGADEKPTTPGQKPQAKASY